MTINKVITLNFIYVRIIHILVSLPVPTVQIHRSPFDTITEPLQTAPGNDLQLALIDFGFIIPYCKGRFTKINTADTIDALDKLLECSGTVPAEDLVDLKCCDLHN